jgi:acyl transferase domain-containing protein/surfactin synthase thioesterase subunit/acyl carrier protein
VVTSYLLAKLHHAELPGQTASLSHINNDKDFLSTRVAFKLNLQGPSFTVQSACSSSLVAIHQACQNLRFNECDMMLAGGSVVRVPQVAGYLAEKRNLHSLDGHCRPFDSVGQGTIFGSGVGAVLLKPLPQALVDRDHIYAVIKGTAANNDGSRKSSYTAPSLEQQSQAVVDALERAGVSAESIGYVECHSTGTIVGDPLEIEALSAAFRKHTQRQQYCAVGSVKANIGHPEQAAGIAGLIKSALVLHTKLIPPSINFETPNPAIDFRSSPFYVNTRLQDFPFSGTPRRAALNSLGIGGTNAFAVLEEAPPLAPRSSASEDVRPGLITLSAKTADALIARVQQFLSWLQENPHVSIGDLTYTTNVSRSQFAFRFAAPARTRAELIDHLTGWLRAADSAHLNGTNAGPIAFMFSGQGAQHAGMAAQLYRTHAVFRNAIDQCHALAQPYLKHGLREVIFAAPSDDALVNRTDYTQPALFSVEYALAQLLKSWGIVPDAVIGHSLGEITAACVVDVLSLEDAIRLVCARGALMHGLPPGGGMGAIMADESVARAVIQNIAPEITVAAINGPLNTVVSGDRDALSTLAQELGRQQITYRELRISNGFHSPRTEPILRRLEKIAGAIRHSAPKLPLISNLTGELMSGAPDQSYWRHHIREPVRFGDGMQALAALNCRSFLEIGPHPVLLPMAQACLQSKARTAVWIATLNRQKSDADSIAEMLAGLYLAGHAINWTAVHADASWRRMPLPTYPFQRKRHWIEDNTAPRERAAHALERVHPLVGTRIESTDREVRYQTRYGIQHGGYFPDHRVRGTVVLPTAAELEAASVLGRIHFGTPRVSFEDAMHHKAMSFRNGEDRVVRLLLAPLSSERAGFTLVSAEAEGAQVWHTHMTGVLRRSEAPRSPTGSSLQKIRSRCHQSLPPNELYDRLERLGLEYGTAFRGVCEVYFTVHEALTRVRLPNGVEDSRYMLHPAFLDACLHAYPLVLDKRRHDEESSYFPVSLTGFRCYQDGIEEAWAHTRLRSVERDGTQVLDIAIYDVAGHPVAELEGLAFRLLPLVKVQAARGPADDVFYRIAWRKKARPPADTTNAPPGSWLIFADANGVGGALAGRLEAADQPCHLVYRGDALAEQGRRKWTVNERQPQHFHGLLAQLSGESLPLRGVAYLWGLDAPPVEDLTLAGLRSGSEMVCRGALGILHALAETRSTRPSSTRLWFVTANTQSTTGREQHVDPVQAPLWGLGRTVAIEYPTLWGGLIDLRIENQKTPDLDIVATELLRPDGETQIAISGDAQRYVPRLIRQCLAELPAELPRVRGDATYLVTGGLGMLGQNVAKWLIHKGARYIVLTGRNATSEAAQELAKAAQGSAAVIRVEAADISREEDVSRLMQRISAELPPLRGVVHSAGVLEDGILAQLDWDRFARLFEPRVYGSWLLHAHTKTLELDFFILKSSLLSLLGSAGQGNYTASSAFLDALAAHRRSADLPARTINWSAWSGGGLATVSGARGEAMWSSLGVEFISPDVAMQAFESLMHREADQIAVAVADWPSYARKVNNPPFLTELLSGNDDADAPQRSILRASVVADTRENGHARQQLFDRVLQLVMSKLGFTDAINPDQALNDLGLDSLMSVNLSNAMEQEFGIPVSVTDLIKGPTINQLVDQLLNNRPGKADSVPTAKPSPPIFTSSVLDRPITPAHAHAAPDLTCFPAALAAPGRRLAGDRYEAGGIALQQVTARQVPQPGLSYTDGGANGEGTCLSVRTNGHTTAGNGNGGSTHDVHARPSRILGAATGKTSGKWLIAPRPNPHAKVRLFCFPYAGGGLVSFRSWPQLLDDSVEVVAVEPPGRGTRIDETAIDDLGTFVDRLLPEMIDWLDRSAAFFGHCLGGLTMFATLCTLPEGCTEFIQHAFACGVRPPHLLKRRGTFEDNLLYDTMLHQDFDVTVPLYAQSDEIFTSIIRQFDTPAADRMLDIPQLRKALLPTIRAEFAMADRYEYRPVRPFSFPISSFVGDVDPWVSQQHSAGWGELTRGRFTHHVRTGSHFLMAEDREFILKTIGNELVPAAL